MEEVSPAHSRTSKYASFSPSRKEEDQQKVGTVEITYLDPVSQKLSNTDVFLDPESWSRRHNEMRFLVSADLVNLVCESHVARQARFRKAKKRLEQARLAFLVDLWKLRGLVERMTRAAEEDLSEDSAGVLSEATHIHFFVPELYFDDYTLECLKRASDVFQKHLLDEMKIMQERLDLLGGKNWRNLLGYALKFMATTEIGSMLMDAIPNPKTRRMVDNAITRGVWDQMDELQPVVEELEEEMEAYNARFDSVQDDIARQLANISSYNERHVQAVTRLEEKEPEIPADSDSEVPEVEEEEEEDEEEDSEEDESATSSTAAWDEEEEIRKFIAMQGQAPSKAQLKKMKKTQMRDAKIAKLKNDKAAKEKEIKGQSDAKIKELLQRWEKKVASAQEELKVLEPSLQQAEELKVEPVDEALLEQSAQAKKMEEEAAKLTQQVEKQQQKVQILQEEVKEEEVKVQQEEEEVQELVQEVAVLPPPDPRWGLLKTLGEQQVELMKKSKISQEKITKITGRVKLLKMELKELCKILGVSFEESSSDDEEEDEDKPYWLRKKLAKKTASERTPFNNHHFLDDEKNALQKRLKRRMKQQKLKEAALLLGRLSAARRTQEHSASDAGTESNVLPFWQDMACCPVPEGEVMKNEDDVTRSLQLLKDTLETTLSHVQKDCKSAGDKPRLDGELRKLIPQRQDAKGLSRQSAESELWLSSSRMSSHSIVPMGESSPQSQDGGLQRDCVLGPARHERLDLKRRPEGLAPSAPSRGAGAGSTTSVDFGFRPDGAGEESVESWSLFKVNKGQSDSSGFPIEKPPLRASLSSERVIQPRPRLDTAASCDFGEYVSQLQQSRGAGHSKSATDLSKNRTPCLPDLINTKCQQKLTALDWSHGPLRRWKSDRRRLNATDRAT